MSDQPSTAELRGRRVRYSYRLTIELRRPHRVSAIFRSDYDGDFVVQVFGQQLRLSRGEDE